MARKRTSNSNRDKRKTYAGIWFLGALSVVMVVVVMLFSRNEHKDRLGKLPQIQREDFRSRSPRTVRMRNDDGVYYIPAKINGQELEFVFDTGASMVSISQVEATLLWKQGKLKEEDILGEAKSSIADGSIVSNTLINLRTIEVAGVTLENVKALVVPNITAPLLLGQSVMSRFGSFTMDYNNNTITFQ